MERTPGTTIATLIAAAGLGALTMFFLDPLSGTRRTALARDRARHWMHEAADAAGTGWRDLRHRASGVAAGARHLVHREQVSDRVLEERVRAELGRWVSHPHAVSVSVRDGRVLRGGAVLTPEQVPLSARSSACAAQRTRASRRAPPCARTAAASGRADSIPTRCAACGRRR